LDPYIHGRVLWASKCERINNHPLHVDLGVIAFHIRLDILENVEIIRVEK
jgi:hypothetical protein